MAQTARDTALDVLLAIEERGAYSNLALTNALRKTRLSSRDVGLTTELVYGTVGRMNTLDYYLTPSLKTPLHKLEPWVRNLLRMTVYQLFYLERIPPFAAINEAVEIAKRRGRKASGFVNGVLRGTLRNIDTLKLPSKEKNWTRHTALLHSHPEWMVQIWAEAFGRETAEQLCEANNVRPALALRVNSSRATRDELLEELAEQGIGAHPSLVSPYGIILHEGLDVTQLPAFREGRCTVQDESSMLVAQALDPQAGERVLDCCAAPGGKTTHLAELMGDEGEVVAVDVHEHKIELIENVANRLGLQSIKTRAGDIRRVVGDAGTFDRILLDAPCSGLGVIKRKPDLKWRKVPGDISEIAELQRDLLNTVAPALRPGGVLVYSTCTVMPEENIDVVRAFLAEHPDFEPDPIAPHLMDVLHGAIQDDCAVQLMPQQFDSDGFFIARLRRKQVN
ncbi:16S rRNA (cytosine(967)-C(5))-methyltransferase [Tumebacillus avium]|uniref:16S rRNA (cytosine(967)-C(5))-methyltransferase n=1 Tax=Tumebacillus avium TaxID=1903704 RepID=A0A1Y0IP60_9BACL|nr:16S rRNA (cytosine(967)-C(5))-methyltransferase RsmB [Tumebacillus avium]ARU62382.1 16S rRNA (cytosine(967)-C(5))-methyltransferase [Tumebacillus avium]